MNETLFFDRVRQSLFKGRMSDAQVRGTSALLDALAGWPTRWVAYGLATAYHETAFTMLPIKERGGKAYLTRMYDPIGERPALAKRMGNRMPGDGVKYAGRGYVQLTWRSNYAKAAAKLGVDLLNDPDMAMHPTYAARIMRAGMEEGWFTGKKLADYLSGTKSDYVGARRIINGTDKAREIADYALAFEAALRAAGYGRPAEKPVERQEPVPVNDEQPEPAAPPEELAHYDAPPPKPAGVEGKPWWHGTIIRPIMQALSGLGITAAGILQADWRVVAVIGGLAVVGVAVWALTYQTRRT
jgi:putative chitinase